MIIRSLSGGFWASGARGPACFFLVYGVKVNYKGGGVQFTELGFSIVNPD